MYNKAFAFSLAEILLVLVIVAVITVMTVPGLQQGASEKAYASMAKKAYATIYNATKSLKLANGPLKYWDYSSKEALSKQYQTKISTATISPEAYDMKNADGTPYNADDMFNPENGFYSADGMLWSVVEVSSDCSATIGDRKYCAKINVDVNGEKTPNTVGRDIYSFYIAIDGVYPDEKLTELMDIKGIKNLEEAPQEE